MTELRTIREGGNIGRFHTRKMIGGQDVAQHSFNAALIAESIAHRVEDAREHRVVMHMLLHDIPELGIGDTPGHIKAQNPQLKEELDSVEREWVGQNFAYRHQLAMYHLNESEAVICKFADLAECAYKGIEDMEMGNRNTKIVVESCIGGLVSVLEGVSPPEYSSSLVNQLARVLKDVSDKFSEVEYR